MSVNFPTMKERIARKLGALAVGNTLAAEDGDLIGERCLSIQKQLDAMELVTIDFADEGIDELYADVIVAMVAAVLVDDFMLVEPKRSQIGSEGALGLPVASVAERQLRKIITPQRVSKPVKAEYF